MILDPQGQPLRDDDPDTWPARDAADLVARMTEEIRVLTDAEAWLELHLQPESALQLAGVVQLALRHPDMPESSREMGTRFLAGIRECFADCPATLDVLRRGDDPSQDVAP